MRFSLIISLLLIVLGFTTSATFGQEAKRRWKKMNQIRRDKFDLILPEAMRENDIDMWIITNREGDYDPLYYDMGGGYTTTNAYYIFTDKEEARIERAVLGMFGYFIEQCGAYDYYGSADELKEYVTQRDPKRIGLKMSNSPWPVRLRI